MDLIRGVTRLTRDRER